MNGPTLVALAEAVRTDSLDRVLPTGPAGDTVRRALSLDRPLCQAYPDSWASCLVARTLGLATLEGWVDGWIRELETSGRPWIRPLRGLSMPGGLLAELRATHELPLQSPLRVAFDSDGLVVATAGIDVFTRPVERLRWDWAQGVVERGLEQPVSSSDAWPRVVERSGWDPVWLVRADGGPRVELPRPAESSASASVLPGGRTVVVYGSLEDYAGGFVWFVRVDTLEVERRLDTRRPVSGVHVGPDRLVVATHDGFEVWQGDQHTVLPIPAGEGALSPDGRHLAVAAAGRLQVWDLEAPMSAPALTWGFPALFDPDGRRLLTGSTLRDGHLGHQLGQVQRFAEPGTVLAGAPAHPWLHLGERYLISMFSGLEVWSVADGAKVSVDERFFHPHWYRLTYDRGGERIAVLMRNSDRVIVRHVPSGRTLTEVEFGQRGMELALSADGSLVAISDGNQVEARRVDDGQLVLTARHPTSVTRHWSALHDQELWFSDDGRQLASLQEPDGWRIWDLDGHLVDQRADLGGAEGFRASGPDGWTVEEGSATVFHHHATGVRLALPVAGTWQCNPGDPSILACDELHVRLCPP